MKYGVEKGFFDFLKDTDFEIRAIGLEICDIRDLLLVKIGDR